MKQTIWYANTPNGVQFATSKDDLTNSNVTPTGNIGSFEVNGEVTGLNYVGQSQSQSQPQHA
jgi:hypothetical protein